MANGQLPDEVKLLIRQLRSQLQGFVSQGVGIIFVLAVVILLWSSWYTVQPEETAVVQRLGRLVRSTGPGLHFKLPFGVETVSAVPTARVLKEEFGFRTLAAGRRTSYERGDFSNESL